MNLQLVKEIIGTLDYGDLHQFKQGLAQIL